MVTTLPGTKRENAVKTPIGTRTASAGTRQASAGPCQASAGALNAAVRAFGAVCVLSAAALLSAACGETARTPVDRTGGEILLQPVTVRGPAPFTDSTVTSAVPPVRPSSRPTAGTATWLARVIVVAPAPRIVARITIVDVERGHAWIERRVGDDGHRDVVVRDDGRPEVAPQSPHVVVRPPNAAEESVPRPNPSARRPDGTRPSSTRSGSAGTVERPRGRPRRPG